MNAPIPKRTAVPFSRERETVARSAG